MFTMYSWDPNSPIYPPAHLPSSPCGIPWSAVWLVGFRDTLYVRGSSSFQWWVKKVPKSKERFLRDTSLSEIYSRRILSEWVKQHHQCVIPSSFKTAQSSQSFEAEHVRNVFALIHISHIHLIISIFFPYQPSAVSTSHSLRPIDLTSFYYRLIILISTGREDSAQLCVYVGGEKV